MTDTPTDPRNLDPRNLDPRNLDDLLGSLRDATITPPEFTRLESLLASDPDARRTYLEYMQLCSSLRRRPAPVPPIETIPVRTASAGRSNPLRLNPIAWSLAAALLIASAVAVYVFVIHPQSEVRNPQSAGPPIATLIESTGTVIANDDIANPGSEYPAGTYSTESGSAQFLLDSRVTVNLKGKTRLRVNSPMSASLEIGSASFTCPSEAKGFTVHLPDRSKIVDLGTAFRIEVDDEGDARLQVTEGRVEWSPADSDGARRVMVAGQIARIVDGKFAADLAIEIANPSFEQGAAGSGGAIDKAPWMRVGGTSTRITIQQLSRIPGRADSTPDGTDSTHYTNNESDSIYQVLPATLAGNTTYRLRVDVGDRLDQTAQPGVIRLGYVSEAPTADNDFGLNLLPAVVVNDAVPVNGIEPDDGWTTWESTFTTPDSPAGLGRPLRVELVTFGRAQTLWDNVRLEIDPEPEHPSSDPQPAVSTPTGVER